jgi:glycogen operon protein
VHRFVKVLNSRRLLRSTEHERQRMSLNRLISQATKAWHGVELDQADWGDQSRSVALTVELRQEKIMLHLMLNSYWEPLEFELPPAGKGSRSQWRRWIDTALESPNDIVEWQQAPAVSGATYHVEARSVVALILQRGQS